jgi:hypothetical protein
MAGVMGYDERLLSQSGVSSWLLADHIRVPPVILGAPR